MRNVIYVNPYVATEGRLGNRLLPEPYILTARFYFCGILDRTGTLDTGFPYHVMDPIPEIPAADIELPDFGQLCDAIGDELIEKAVAEKKQIQVLWSGGIDSTLILIALLKAAEKKNCTDVIEVLLTIESVQEYSDFYAQHIRNRLACRPVTHPVFRYIDNDKMIVTGEHGDQLFGSDYLSKYVPTGTAWLDYEEILPMIVASKLGDPKKADIVVEYLKPQIENSPVPINTVFDLFWWLNFSLKWQHVTFRTVIYHRKEHRKTYDSIFHFFRDPRFQVWSLTNRDKVINGDWDSYKYVAKEYILQFTNDEDYFRDKKKEVSLWGYSKTTEDNWGKLRELIYMCDDFQPCHDVFALQDDWEH